MLFDTYDAAKSQFHSFLIFAVGRLCAIASLCAMNARSSGVQSAKYRISPTNVWDDVTVSGCIRPSELRDAPSRDCTGNPHLQSTKCVAPSAFFCFDIELFNAYRSFSALQSIKFLIQARIVSILVFRRLFLLLNTPTSLEIFDLLTSYCAAFSFKR